MNEILITLPDGSTKEYNQGITGLKIAESIGLSLAKAAVAIKINNNLQDLSSNIIENAHIEIITSKSDDYLEIIRHDTAHILAEAVQDLYPDAQVTIGPIIKDGFYYDFARKEPFLLEDLEKIEKHMHKIVKRNEKIEKEIWDRDKAIEYFKTKNEKYKVELIEAIPEGEDISFYRQGKFIDLCRGPHASSTGKVKFFKLLKVSGAYWRGDSKNEMLQRIYGTAWATEKDLNAHIERIEEAEKRDHRVLAKTMDLFHIQEEATGQIFWHDKGWTLYRILENYIRDQLKKHDYLEVKTPILASRVLWEKSGHWEKFQENMFLSESEGKTLAIKPMNCPCHIMIFNKQLRSYRDLPLRMSEFGACHRNEPSGSLHGLMRVRGFTQDDAHIFCTEDQITSETISFCNLLLKVYKSLGFEEVRVKFSDRPEKRAGSDAIWDKAENALKEAIEATGLEYSLNPGEGAFYGPKIEFVLIDAIGRNWQCGTLQVDFVLPERLDASYIGSDGNKHPPVILHRAILGSFERFIGILIEHYAGKFPLWLSPLQVVVATITNETDDYAKKVFNLLKESGIRSELDLDNNKISYKIRHHSLTKTPIILAIGNKEAESNTVSVRRLGSKDQETLDLNLFISTIVNESSYPCNFN